MGRDGVRRKDWHNYEAIRRDQSRSGRSAGLPPTVQWFVSRCSVAVNSIFPFIHENFVRLSFLILVRLFL